ncbi:MAG: fibronectin type III domain-containing protein, partial [Clostridia bacterium]|nr:fibronectin type III domain-containing protein [Clostridia bacterium]
MKHYPKKRFLALMLALLLLVLALPAPAVAQTVEAEGRKGTDFSENTYISGQLQILFDKLVYSDTPYFTVQGSSSCGNVACTSCGLAEVSKKHPALSELGVTFDTTAYGSGAFARYAFALIFGVKLSAINYFGNTVATIPLQTVGRVAAERSAGLPAAGVSGSYLLMSGDNLKEILQSATPGDLLQARSTTGGNHSMVFLGRTESGVTVLHSIDYNVDGVEKNKVVISEMSYEEMVSAWGQIITLFRAEADAYAETWAKGETVHLTCRYTDEAGNNCAVCGKAISPLPAVSVTGAGVYMASVATASYEGYYRSTAKKTAISAGKWVTAVGSVVNSTGKTFYLLSDGSYAPAEDFGKGTGTAPTINLTAYPSGEMTYGSSFNLKGTISVSGGLSYVAGYMLEQDGAVNHSVTQSTTSSSLDVYYSQINSKMKFGSLAQGDYVMMIVACSASGAMSAKLYPFSVVKKTLVTPSAPSAPTVASKTATSVTLTAVSGYQYSKNGTSWQSSNVFTGLSPATTYTFYQRIAATSTSNASPASAGLSVTTNKSGSSAPSAPTVASKTATSVTLTAVSGYQY